jgi:hypothetical protein
MKINKKSILFFGLASSLLLSACGGEKSSDEEKKGTTPAFCDCVNKDYHQKGDREKCKKIEKELTMQLEKADQNKKGEILMKIQDCKVQGQYDND